jgi:hypothetical protein
MTTPPPEEHPRAADDAADLHLPVAAFAALATGLAWWYGGSPQSARFFLAHAVAAGLAGWGFHRRMGWAPYLAVTRAALSLLSLAWVAVEVICMVLQERRFLVIGLLLAAVVFTVLVSIAAVEWRIVRLSVRATRAP